MCFFFSLLARLQTAVGFTVLNFFLKHKGVRLKLRVNQSLFRNTLYSSLIAFAGVKLILRENRDCFWWGSPASGVFQNITLLVFLCCLESSLFEIYTVQFSLRGWFSVWTFQIRTWIPKQIMRLLWGKILTYTWKLWQLLEDDEIMATKITHVEILSLWWICFSQNKHKILN